MLWILLTMSNSLLFGQIQGYALGDVPAYSSDYKAQTMPNSCPTVMRFLQLF